MSNNIIKNVDISHDELVYLYNQNSAKLKKEHESNVQLKAYNKRLLEQLKCKNRVINESIERLQIALKAG